MCCEAPLRLCVQPGERFFKEMERFLGLHYSNIDERCFFVDGILWGNTMIPTTNNSSSICTSGQ